MWSRTFTAAMFLVLTCTVGYAQRGESFQRLHVQTFDLGTFAPGMDSFARSINNRGEIVGTAVEGNQGNAFLWTPRKGFRLIREFANANDINNQGEVVGVLFDCVAPPPPGGSCGRIGKGYIWSASEGFRDLGTSFVPVSINDNGDIAGGCRRPGFGFDACMRMSDGTLVKAPVDNESLSRGLNIYGDSVVTAPSTTLGQAFLVDRKGRLKELRSQGLAQADGINDWGVVVGSQSLPSGRFATVWFSGHRVRADVQSEGYNINNLGQVAGAIVEDDLNHRGPMLWDLKWGVVPLGPIVNNIDSAQDINDRGDIVGVSRVSSGELHVMLWRVTPGGFRTQDHDDDSEEGHEPF